MSGLEITILASIIGVLGALLGVFVGFLLEMKRDSIAKDQQKNQQLNHLYQEIAVNKIKANTILDVLSKHKREYAYVLGRFETRAYDMLYNTGNITVITNDIQKLVEIESLYMALREANRFLISIDDIAEKIAMTGTTSDDKNASDLLHKGAQNVKAPFISFLKNLLPDISKVLEILDTSRN